VLLAVVSNVTGTGLRPSDVVSDMTSTGHKTGERESARETGRGRRETDESGLLQGSYPPKMLLNWYTNSRLLSDAVRESLRLRSPK